MLIVVVLDSFEAINKSVLFLKFISYLKKINFHPLRKHEIRARRREVMVAMSQKQFSLSERARGNPRAQVAFTGEVMKKLH